MRVLGGGGAGYIGSHMIRLLLQSGHEVKVFDNLILWHVEAVPEGLLICGDLADPSGLESSPRDQHTEAVIHYAAFASVPESVAEPARFYPNNLVGSVNLLDAMRATGVRKLIISSTYAVYGIPDVLPIFELSPTRPISPYSGSRSSCTQTGMSKPTENVLGSDLS
jgi:UDP-glucose 4-epimerase